VQAVKSRPERLQKSRSERLQEKQPKRLQEKQPLDKRQEPKSVKVETEREQNGK
jgi:hypothetical protein